ncbi:uncharacterized protein DS421_16g550000 [Arachis hypogaea]|nr:uncharacterized protein DS421_16g550000 [Arachis hypogaea]
MSIGQRVDSKAHQNGKTLALGSLPPASPGSALSFLPLPSVRNPGSSARRPHPRWLLYLWLGAARHRITACRRLCSRRRVAGCRRVSVEVKLVDPEVKERNDEEEGGEELSDIYHSPRVFKLNYAEMMKFKVCIYSDGDPKTFYQTPRKLTGKYASEGYFFQNIRESRFQTLDPDQAHLFFIPISCHKMRDKDHHRIIPDTPSERMMSLPTTRKLALKNKIVFGTGDHWHAPTLTANMAFVRAVSRTGMSLYTIEHRPRALTGD